MRGKRERGERRIEDALEALSRALTESGAPWMIIGGIAIIAHGVRRMTTDIDAVVRGDSVEIGRLLRTLARHQITPRIAHALAFARANLVLLVRHAPSDVDLDVSFAWTTFEHEALGARTSMRYGAVEAPMATAEDLLVLKAMAGRPKDIEDAAALLALWPRIDLKRARTQLRALAELANDEQPLSDLDQIVGLVRSARAHGKPRSERSKRTTRSKRLAAWRAGGR